jgi:hypothetical protein
MNLEFDCCPQCRNADAILGLRELLDTYLELITLSLTPLLMACI